MLSKGMCVCLLKMRMHRMIGSRGEKYRENAAIPVCVCVITESASRVCENMVVISTRDCSWECFKNLLRYFHRGPVVKTVHFHHRGMGLIPGQGTKILPAMQPKTINKIIFFNSLT